jgi:hypothetical protein
MSRSYTSSPPSVSMARSGTPLPFTKHKKNEYMFIYLQWQVATSIPHYRSLQLLHPIFFFTNATTHSRLVNKLQILLKCRQ